jgi:hypothetical protein
MIDLNEIHDQILKGHLEKISIKKDEVIRQKFIEKYNVDPINFQKLGHDGFEFSSYKEHGIEHLLVNKERLVSFYDPFFNPIYLTTEIKYF